MHTHTLNGTVGGRKRWGPGDVDRARRPGAGRPTARAMQPTDLPRRQRRIDSWRRRAIPTTFWTCHRAALRGHSAIPGGRGIRSRRLTTATTTRGEAPGTRLRAARPASPIGGTPTAANGPTGSVSRNPAPGTSGPAGCGPRTSAAATARHRAETDPMAGNRRRAELPNQRHVIEVEHITEHAHRGARPATGPGPPGRR